MAGDPRPLLVTDDPERLDELLRLAAAGGCEVDAAVDAGGAAGSWATAPVVVLDDRAAESCTAAGLPRRGGVVLVGSDLDDADVWPRAVAVGAEHVVFLPDAEPWLVDLFADTADGGGGTAPVVAVIGGRGGAGATVLATALAVGGLRRGCRTLLIDADPLGGGIDLLFGGEDAAGLRWPDLAAARGRLSAPALTEALPNLDDLTVLSWDRGPAVTVPVEAMASLLRAGRRGSDLVVVDLPRRLDATAEHVLGAAALTLLVVPAEVRACAAATRVAALLRPLCADLRAVVRGPAPSGLSGEAVQGGIGVPVVAFLKPEPGLARALERGEPPGRGRGPLGELCADVLSELLGRAAAPLAA